MYLKFSNNLVCISIVILIFQISRNIWLQMCLNVHVASELQTYIKLKNKNRRKALRQYFLPPFL